MKNYEESVSYIFFIDPLKIAQESGLYTYALDVNPRTKLNCWELSNNHAPPKGMYSSKHMERFSNHKRRLRNYSV
jgi:hypothetical protein